jgi:hypothetical protein
MDYSMIVMHLFPSPVTATTSTVTLSRVPLASALLIKLEASTWAWVPSASELEICSSDTALYRPSVHNKNRSPVLIVSTRASTCSSGSAVSTAWVNKCRNGFKSQTPIDPENKIGQMAAQLCRVQVAATLGQFWLLIKSNGRQCLPSDLSIICAGAISYYLTYCN